MDLKDATENLQFDVRMIEMNLKNGSITKEQYQQYLSSLNDIADEAQKLELEEDVEAEASDVETDEAAISTEPSSSDNPYLQ